MDKSAWDYLRGKIELEEHQRGIELEERADRGKRIPWEWIENVILDEICTLTLGEYFFRPLLSVAHNDSETRLNWCTHIKFCQTLIENYKHGWDKIGCKSAVNKLWYWFSHKEQKVILQYFKGQRQQIRYRQANHCWGYARRAHQDGDSSHPEQPLGQRRGIPKVIMS